MSARKKKPAKLPKKKTSAKKASAKKAPAKKTSAKAKSKKAATKRSAAKPAKQKPGAKKPTAVSTNPEFDSYVRRLTKCKSIEDLRKCSEGTQRGDPFAWQKTFDVVLFGLSFKEESGRSIREAIQAWSHALVLDEKLPPDQHVQILGRLGLLPPALLGNTGLTE